MVRDPLRPTADRRNQTQKTHSRQQTPPDHVICLLGVLSGPHSRLSPRASRAAVPFLSLSTDETAATAQGKMQVKCKLCDKTVAGFTMRMAAHFAKKPNFNVAKCTKATPECFFFFSFFHVRVRAIYGSLYTLAPE